MPVDPPTGRALVSRRALVDLVRTATLGSYGVTGFAATLPERLLALAGAPQPGIRLSFRHGMAIELDLTIAAGLPIAEVARQVDSAVRYAVRQATQREVDRLTIHVEGLRWQPTAPRQASAARPSRGRGVERDVEPDGTSNTRSASRSGVGHQAGRPSPPDGGEVAREAGRR